jgi:hypothetical protein
LEKRPIKAGFGQEKPAILSDSGLSPSDKDGLFAICDWVRIDGVAAMHSGIGGIQAGLCLTALVSSKHRVDGPGLLGQASGHKKTGAGRFFKAGFFIDSVRAPFIS